MDHHDPTSEILLILPELSRRLRPLPRQAGDANRASLAQVKAMNHLAQHGQQTMSELARGLDISLPAATDLVDRMLAAGAVERVRDERDRRIVLVRLSPAAHERMKPLIEYRRRAVRDVLEQLGENEAEIFMRGLRLLADALRHEKMLMSREHSGDE